MEPDEKVEFSDARASLWSCVTLKVAPSQTTSADRMQVEHQLGTTEDLLVLIHDGQRTVLRVQQVMQLEGGDPAVPVSVSWGHKADPVAPEEAKKLLAIYDRFEKRTYKK
jgi:hypothetical protein